MLLELFVELDECITSAVLSSEARQVVVKTRWDLPLLNVLGALVAPERFREVEEKACPLNARDVLRRNVASCNLAQESDWPFMATSDQTPQLIPIQYIKALPKFTTRTA